MVDDGILPPAVSRQMMLGWPGARYGESRWALGYDGLSEEQIDTIPQLAFTCLVRRWRGTSCEVSSTSDVTSSGRRSTTTWTKRS
jgi:hypothetical protein